MSAIRRFLLRLFTVFRAASHDRDLTRELDADRGLLAAEFERAGGVLAAAPLLRQLPAPLAPQGATPLTASALLVALALVACAVPALRVTRVNPAAALRCE